MTLFIGQGRVCAQSQIGLSIYGTYFNNELGKSISMPDSFCIAAGEPYSLDSIILSGKVRVFTWTGQIWSQLGGDILGKSFGEQSGLSVSMPDRKTVGIGAPKNDSMGTDAGLVRVYRYKNGSWQQKGPPILGDSAQGEFGTAIEMPDSNTIAIGTPYYDGPNGPQYGLVRVFSWHDSIWVQKGNDFSGSTAIELLGWSVAMPDSNHLAIGATQGSVISSGQVDIYRWNNGSWNLMGNSIIGDTAGQGFGYTISMPDSNTVAIGSKSTDNNGNITAKVFSFANGQWDQKGGDIVGDFPTTFNSCDLDTYDENHITVGAPSPGEVYRFVWNGTQWVNTSNTISHIQVGEKLGYAVAMPHPDIIGVGSPEYDNDSLPLSGNQGRISVYRYCDSSQFSYGVDSILACGSYRWIDSNVYTSDNDTSVFTISNRVGCDSIVTLNLTIIDIDTGVTVNTPTLTALDSGANYQWFACDSGFVPIPGANHQSFTAVKNGQYAVVIGKNGCADTSTCISIDDIGTQEYTQNSLKIYPNPVKDFLTITASADQFDYHIYAIDGTCLQKGHSEKPSLKISVSELPAGVFLLKIYGDQLQATTRLYKAP